MKIFMKIDKIKGSATDEKHKGWIELETFNLGVSAPSTMVSGGMGRRQYSTPDFSAPTFTKRVDMSSGGLFSCATSNTVIPEVIITITDGKTDCLKYTLSDVIIASREIQLHNGVGVIESGTLSYSKILETYTEADSSGRALSPYTAGYDLATAEVL